MSLRLISTSNGQLIWMTSGTLDTSQPDVVSRAAEFFAKSNEKDSLLDAHTLLMAERRYVEFVTNEFLLTMDKY